MSLKNKGVLVGKSVILLGKNLFSTPNLLYMVQGDCYLLGVPITLLT